MGTQIYQRDWLAAFLFLVLALTSTAAQPQGFAAMASPPRFELRAAAGERLRTVLEINNRSGSVASYGIKTADWGFDPQYNLQFHDTPVAGSCRPWVALERREVKVAADGRLRFRFEVQVPSDTPVTECRFALLIEGMDPMVGKTQNFAFPISGRLAVIVYVAIGGAKPKLEIAGAEIVEHEGQRLPSVMVKNSGTAHGRLAGLLTATDSTGTVYDLSPHAVPILPGDTRRVMLLIDQAQPNTRSLAYPIMVEGKLEFDNQRLTFSHRYAP